MRERFKAEPHEAVCRYLFGPAIETDNRRSFHNMSDINVAHAMMLDRAGIIPHEDAKKLIGGLLKLHDGGPEALTLDPKLEDYYFNIEQNLKASIGADAAGHLHTGRSRNDLATTLSRMNIRDEVSSLIPRMFELRKQLIRLAEENRETVITGYTHMQPAQPISLGHYFSAIAEAVERDYERVYAAFGRMNCCTLGGGAFAGTSFPVDREYVAEMLGFSGPIYNSIDAVATRDYILDLISSFAIMGSTINRFVSDLYIWATAEFSYIEVDDSVAACSSIMPQKKNPITLEHVKAKSAHLIAAFVSAAGTLKGIPFGHCRDVGAEVYTMFWEAASQTEAMLELLNATLATLKVKKEGMEERARRNFCIVTEIADELVKSEGVPFRLGHGIVGSVVRRCIDEGKSSAEITVDMINAAAEEVIGRRVAWSEERVNEIMSPSRSVHDRISMGGSAPQECDRMTANLRKALDRDSGNFTSDVKRCADARKKLYEEARGKIKN